MKARILTPTAIRKIVVKRQGGECAETWCTAAIEAIHHLLKRSTFPQFVHDPDIQIGFCGSHHAQCEARLLAGEDVSWMYPQDQWKIAQRKAGLI